MELYYDSYPISQNTLECKIPLSLWYYPYGCMKETLAYKVAYVPATIGAYFQNGISLYVVWFPC